MSTAQLPEWKTSAAPIQEHHRQDQIRVTDWFLIEAFSYYRSSWHAHANIALTQPQADYPTPEGRLRLLRETLAVLDEARPVLVAMIEAAERTEG